MQQDKYSALWLSHSSISDFLKCPQAYYLKNIYKNTKTGRKISLVKPALSLGQAVHTVIDTISILPATKRLEKDLAQRYKTIWAKFQGIAGGFESKKEEEEYYQRGLDMINRLKNHPGPIVEKQIKIKDSLPNYWFDRQNNIILCGKIDWLQFDEKKPGVNIIDFKTGRLDEREDSLQLPIYYLLATNTQKYPVIGLYYWYLDRKNKPTPVKIPDTDKSIKKINEIAGRIKLARKLSLFHCQKGKDLQCIHCAPYKAIVAGKAKFVGISQFKEEQYFLSSEAASLQSV